MYIINDIDFLLLLNKLGILKIITETNVVAYSEVRLLDYSNYTKNAVRNIRNIEKIRVDESFNDWMKSKRKYLTLSDLSTIYIAKQRIENCIVITLEDEMLIGHLAELKVSYVLADEFIESTVKDKKIIQLYHLLKVA